MDLGRRDRSTGTITQGSRKQDALSQRKEVGVDRHNPRDGEEKRINQKKVELKGREGERDENAEEDGKVKLTRRVGRSGIVSAGARDHGYWVKHRWE